MKHVIRFVLNGEDKELTVESNTTLLELLRDRLRVTSPKRSCEQGECGACTVILGGKAVNACLVLAASIDGKAVETVDGLGTTELHPLQKYFVGPLGQPVRLLHPGHDHGCQGPCRCQSRPHLRGGQGGPVGQPVPVHGVRQACGSGARRGPGNCATAASKR